MSESLRELLVEISYVDRASAPLARVDRAVDGVRDGFGSMGRSAASASSSITDLGSRSNKTSKDIKRIESTHRLWNQTASGMDRILHGNQRAADSLRSQINVLDREISVSNRNLERTQRLYGQNSREALAYRDHILELRLEQSRLNNELNGMSLSSRVGAGFTKTGEMLDKAGGWATTRITLPLAAVGTASLKTFVSLEEAYAGVKKTVDGTDKQLADIRKELDHSANTVMPVARKELYGIAENAGQLGVKTKDVTSFTSTIAKLGATTDLTYDSASSQIAQFANITDMQMDNVGRLGSTIVDLGNNTATTESKIMGMAMRLGAAGKQVGMSQAEIIGLSAGLSSLGLEAEGGGTAVSKLLFDMQKSSMSGGKQLNKYAKVAGVSGKVFKKAFEDNAASALVMFTEGLGKLQKDGVDVISMLDGMGLSEVRLRDAILRTAGSNSLLNDTINMGNEAWKENNALNNEFNKYSETTAANIQITKNKLEGIGNTVGENLVPHLNIALDKVGKLAEGFGNLDQESQGKIVNIGLGLLLLGPTMKVLSPIMKGVGWLIPKIGLLTSSIGAAGGLVPWLGTAGTAFVAFATGPVGIAIGAIAALSAAIYGVIKYKDELKELGASAWQKTKDIGNAAWENTKNAFNNKVDFKDMPMDYYRKDVGGSSISSKYNKPQTTVKPQAFPGYSYTPKKVGANALGTNHWRGGLTELGERGPELIIGRQTRDLANGAKVVNARDTEDIFSKSTPKDTWDSSDTYETNIYITMTGGSSEDIKKLKREIEREIEPAIEKIFAKAKMKRLRMA